MDRRPAGCALGDIPDPWQATVYGEGSLAKLREANEAGTAIFKESLRSLDEQPYRKNAMAAKFTVSL